jgi:trimethylamine--corrinoid protein Co-methyltransferase
MDLGGDRSYFGTGSDLIFALEGRDFTRRPCRLADVQRAALVGDALTHIDFIMSFAHPSDITPGRAYLASVHAMATHSVKPIVCTAADRADLSCMWEIAAALRGGEAELRARPYIIHYAEPISPLKHPYISVDKLLLCAEKQLPVIYSPAPIAGSTAPMTIAGHVVQGLAESICGLVIHQLKAPGAPFLLGMGPAVLDMATAQCSYNAPEYLLAYLAAVEMSRYFDLPNWGYAGTSDAHLPDGQAVFEAGLLIFLSAMAGSNLNHDVGYLDFGRTGNLEMIVIADEIIGQVRRLLQGIPVQDDSLALDVIREVGAGNHFLTHPHTLRHVRSVQWRPQLFNRQGFEGWCRAGSPDLLHKARLRLEKILQEYRPPALPPEQSRRIRRIWEAYEG